MVAANNGLIGMAREHLGIALALNVPVMVIVTKIDICPPQILQQTLSQVTKILKSPGARKIPVFVDTMDECVSTASQFVSRRICPIFQVSNVTGQNLDLVRTFLNILPHHGSYDPEAPFEFHINDTFSVPFVGTVVSGVVRAGRVSAGDTVLVGPDSTGQFATTKIRTIERKRIGVQTVSAGQSGSFALRGLKRKDVRKGMVVMHPSGTAPGSAGLVNALANNSATKDAGPGDPKAYREFMAEVLILSHATTIKAKYQAMLHVGPVSQTCAIIDIFSPSPLAASEKPTGEEVEDSGNGLKVEQREYIRTGDRALVAFKFVQRPEFLSIGDRILFREGRTKGLGVVKGLGYDKNNPFANVMMV
jgi:GTPase